MDKWSLRGVAGLGLMLAVVAAPGCKKEDSKGGAADPAKGGSTETTSNGGGGDSNNTTSGGGGSAPAPIVDAAPSVPAKPGFVIGRVLSEDGRPIGAGGAVVTVNVFGTAKDGSRVSHDVKVGQDGAYEQSVAEGAYRADATIKTPYGGRTYTFFLHPAQNNRADRASAGGIVQDFVWKIRGARPGQSGGSDPYGYYGGTVNAAFESRDGQAAPAGTKVAFTLTPKGPLIDGSQGRPVTFERGFDPVLGGLTDSHLVDIPVGAYTIAGVEKLPDGTTKPIQVRQFGQGAYADSADVEFTPDTPHLKGLQVATVQFARK